MGGLDGLSSFPAVQDELTTTKRSYEDQLSMMSDHLCSMNETLSKQRDEIDTLKMSSKVCGRQPAHRLAQGSARKCRTCCV